MKSILILVDDLYEDLELWYPKIRLEEAGFKAPVAGHQAGHIYQGKHGYPCKADLSFSQIDPAAFDGLLIPGGYAPDKLRRDGEVLKIVQAIHSQKKVIAFICHAGWVLISAKILKGRKATSYAAIKDDMENAGVKWEDSPLVIDHHLISARSPADLPVFGKAIIDQLKK